MNFDFFTFGGGQFWEDVFFYQKWRIQRNYNSKKYRLLDPWDIRRHKGSFEECRKAFIKFIEIYEISRQHGHMVIMLHGLTDSKNIFKPLWRAVLAEGYMAAAINYPSTRKQIDAHIRQIDFLLNNLEDITEISFITKGCGGLILRKLLNYRSPWHEKIKISRIVQISPPNQGSAFLEKLSKFAIFRWIFGPMLEEASYERAVKLPLLPKKVKAGIIFCDHPINRISQFLPKSFKKLLPVAKEADLEGVSDKIHVKNIKFNILENKKTIDATVNFLKRGTFK